MNILFSLAIFLSLPNPQVEKATFAGGCFWCMEPPFDKVEGVLQTTSGYIGGEEKNPTYDEVSSGTTGHTEALEILYNPSRVSYQELLQVYWRNIDPTVANRQFCDVGPQYKTAIFVHSEKAKRACCGVKKRGRKALS